MSTPYQQVQCPRCHAAAWALPDQAVPCQACGSPVPPTQPVAAPMPFGGAPAPWGTPPPASAAPGAPNAWGQAPAATPLNNNGGPAHLQQPQGSIKIPGLPGAFGKINLGGSNIKFKIIGGVVLAIALGIAGVFVKMKMKGTPKGVISMSTLGLDAAHADPDVMITALAGPAKAWKKDAVWWSINVLGLRADGTVDLTAGGVAQVAYASPSAAGSHAKKTRDDSVTEFNVTEQGARTSNQLIGFTEVIENFEGPDLPKCSVKQVAAILAKRGLSGTKTVHLNFDLQFSSMVGAEAWHVLGDDPQLNLWISTADCSIVKS
ncbi:MAG: hypothetical protein K8W52_40130 [Deltaproteobacteria bacterium]|nr:hypothetical protein [Deltaproteobacteria bacterium]